MDKLKAFLVVSILLLSALSVYTIRHEQAHAEVFRNFGCTSTFQIEGMAFATVAENCSITPLLAATQGNVEAIGYQAEAVIIGVFLMLYGLVLTQK